MRVCLGAVAALVLLTACGGGTGADGASSPEDLIGRAFAATSVVERGEDRELTGSRMVVHFQERDGIVTVRWKAACNTSSGVFEITPERLVPQPEGVTGFPSTEQGCTPDGDRVDGWMGSVFADAPAWVLGGESLVLTTETVEIELTESTWR